MFFPPTYRVEDTGDRPTWPPPGIRSVVIEDRCEPLFTSATWTMVIDAEGTIVASSASDAKPHSVETLCDWAKQAIRERYAELRQLGVDADAEYIRLGGNAKDLHP